MGNLAKCFRPFLCAASHRGGCAESALPAQGVPKETPSSGHHPEPRALNKAVSTLSTSIASRDSGIYLRINQSAVMFIL